MQTANFGQQTANFGQIVTCFRLHGVGYDLATEHCLFFGILMSFLPDILITKSPTNH